MRCGHVQRGAVYYKLSDRRDDGTTLVQGTVDEDYDLGSLKLKRSLYDRKTHFTERMTQFMGIEPKVYNRQWERIMATFDDMYRGRPKPRELTKPEVKELIKRAKLPMKQFLEKWLQIADRLLGPGWRPKPSGELVMSLQDKYRTLESLWPETREHFRALHGVRRKNIPNLNMTICALLLMHGQDIYDRYERYFPQINKPKWTQVWRMYTHMALRAGWCPRVPVRRVGTAKTRARERGRDAFVN